MAFDIQRYVDIMRRTGLPVILAQEEIDPIVLMPLDAYEMLLGADSMPEAPAADAHFPPIEPLNIQKEQAPVEVVPPSPSPAPESPVNTTVPSKQKMEDQPKQAENKLETLDSAMSAEERFFLEPIE